MADIPLAQDHWPARFKVSFVNKTSRVYVRPGRLLSVMIKSEATAMVQPRIFHRTKNVCVKANETL